MSIRRACYDKPHRCPGWAGGGFRYPKEGKSICDNGYIPYSESRLDGWAVKKCGECGTIRLPIYTKWLDPAWLKFWIGMKLTSWKIDREEMGDA
ncbi:MAG: hypothetical protein ABWY20_08325 [Mycobacterium sp.]